VSGMLGAIVQLVIGLVLGVVMFLVIQPTQGSTYQEVLGLEYTWILINPDSQNRFLVLM